MNNTSIPFVYECEFCGGHDFSEVERDISRNIPITNVICKKCTLVHMETESLINPDEFYSSGKYWAESGDALGIVANSRSAHIINFCSPFLKEGITVLDIGCASGDLLAEIRKRFGCRVVGLEPDPYLSEQARYVNDIRVITSTLQEWPDEGFKADLVVMSHVLEHFESPRFALKKVLSLLSENGVLYVEVPNLYAHPSFELAHPFSFNKFTLKEIMNLEGFETVWLRTHPGGRSLRLPYFISTIARLAQNNDHPRKIFPGYRCVLIRRKVFRNLVKISEYMLGVLVKVLTNVVSDGQYRTIRSFLRGILRIKE